MTVSSWKEIDFLLLIHALFPSTFYEGFSSFFVRACHFCLPRAAGIMATAVSGSQNHYNAVVGVDAACCVISVACICLRLYVRKHLVHKVALDDWLLLFGVVSCHVQTNNYPS